MRELAGGFGLGGDEITDIRVRHIKHSHTGATPATAHGDHTRGTVIQP
ncbi:Uncharacterised protein [Mycobacterium tuberculosis]|uniref:Uncharacterized protein n=1 Tax=Mycobacterium tuberculosis TaxID=1773 RepID=A0A655JQC6_MYCTX|nr:Uncharacterised protein [Mycobacterium tuberculosis]COX40670.1 Uncharacterised protein [Mycobacterium tuberculosis]CPB34332.1 Uncharacterised protein [Mycobacterium tuberculosis]CPB35179.1 Uncharacterised protein [Mycobacterium tuberculosis]CPB73154.1 Uncharacterised protein [Mycobacterium tuberculosis]